MASSEVFNIDELIAPISSEHPCGEDLRENSAPDSLYYKVKDARNAARSHERKNMFEHNSEALELWRTVLQVSPEILKNHSKDLEIASWYIEALIRTKGFAGLRDGFLLVEKLVEGYWDNIYPLPDEDGIETTVAPLAGLNGSGAEGVLIAPIRRVLITEDEDPGPFGFWQYQQALDIQKIADESEREKKIQSVGFSLESIEKSVQVSSSDFFINQRDDIASAIEIFKNIGKMLDERCGVQDAPSTSNIINALQQCLGAIKHLGKNKFPIESNLGADEALPAEVTQDQGLQQTASIGAIKTREQAFQQLKLISEYFLLTEPHSPISYTLEKTIKWGDMSLNELIAELIPDSNSRQLYSSLTGVNNEN